MCIIHEKELHYVYQNILNAFEESKMLSDLFIRRVGNLICNCENNLLFDSKTLINTQRALYKWFNEAHVQSAKEKRLGFFYPIIEEFKTNGKIDSSTKIAFLRLLKDLDGFDYSKLRDIANKPVSKSNKKKPNNRKVFYTKLVRLKFDLKLCSIKEFCELVSKIDNCAIKYIQLTNKCKITLRDIEHLGIRHFMGEIDATIESKSDKHLNKAELSLKRLADAVHYRLTKQMPTSDSMVGGNSFSNLKVLLQSPPKRVSNLDTTNSDVSFQQASCESSLVNNMTRSFTTTTSQASRNRHYNRNRRNTDWSETDISKKMFVNMSFGSEASSNTMNNNQQSDSSMLYFNQNNSFRSYGSTPLTSSPMSTSPNSSALKAAVKNGKSKSKKHSSNPSTSAVKAASKKLNHLINHNNQTHNKNNRQPTMAFKVKNYKKTHSSNGSKNPSPTNSNPKYSVHKKVKSHNYYNDSNNSFNSQNNYSYNYDDNHNHHHNNNNYHQQQQKQHNQHQNNKKNYQSHHQSPNVDQYNQHHHQQNHYNNKNYKTNYNNKNQHYNNNMSNKNVNNMYNSNKNSNSAKKNYAKSHNYQHQQYYNNNNSSNYYSSSNNSFNNSYTKDTDYYSKNNNKYVNNNYHGSSHKTNQMLTRSSEKKKYHNQQANYYNNNNNNNKNQYSSYTNKKSKSPVFNSSYYKQHYGQQQQQHQPSFLMENFAY